MRLVFIGPPGSGKTTQAQALAHQWQIPYISTGEMVRQAIAANTCFGSQMRGLVEWGELVPDGLMLTLLKARFCQPDIQRGWILTGFPRTLDQVQVFDQLMVATRQRYDRVFSFYASHDVIIRRLLQRSCSDDHMDAIRRRLEIYQERTAPLIPHYRKRNCLTALSGDLSIAHVSQVIQDSLQCPIAV